MIMVLVVSKKATLKMVLKWEINHAIAILLITFLTALLSFIIVWGIGKVVPFSNIL